MYKLVPKNWEIVIANIDVEKKDNRIKLERKKLDYKCNIVKDFLIAFIDEINWKAEQEAIKIEKKRLIENWDEDVYTSAIITSDFKEYTMKDIDIAEFRKWVCKIEDGYYSKFVKRLWERILKHKKNKDKLRNEF